MATLFNGATLYQGLLHLHSLFFRVSRELCMLALAITYNAARRNTGPERRAALLPDTKSIGLVYFETFADVIKAIARKKAEQGLAPREEKCAD